MRMRSMATRASSGVFSQFRDESSQSLGPRWPWLDVNPAKSSRNVATAGSSSRRAASRSNRPSTPSSKAEATDGCSRTVRAMAYRSCAYSADLTFPADPRRCVTRPGWPAAAQASARAPATIDARPEESMWLWKAGPKAFGKAWR